MAEKTGDPQAVERRNKDNKNDKDKNDKDTSAAEKAADPQALEREIERTRGELAQTIDALADRVSPKNVARRGVTQLKEDAGRFMTKVGGVVRQDADQEEIRRIAPPLLIGAGVVCVVAAVWVLGRRRK